MTVIGVDGAGSGEVEAPERVASERRGSPRAAPDIGGLCGALAGLLGLAIGLTPLHDNSFLTHLATGRLILADGAVPTADPYSFTAEGTAWTVQSWLASVVYATAEEVGGFGGIRLVNGLLCAAIGVCVWLLTSRSPSVVVRLGVTGAVLAAGSAVLSGRPLLFGLLGLALTFLAADGRLDPRWLVPVGWVWVNAHGSFPYAIGLLGLLAIGRRLDDGAWGREVRVLGWSAVGIAAGALNPLGPRLLLFPVVLLRKTESFGSIIEWQAPTYRSWAQYAVLALVLVAVVALGRRWSWRDGLVFVAFVGLGLTAQRNQAVLLLVLAPILAGTLPPVGPTVRSLARPIMGPARVLAVALAALLVAFALSSPHVSLEAYPEDLTVWMDDEGMWGPDSRVVAPDFVGNLREAQIGRGARVFFDDRVDMYPEHVLDDYQVLMGGEPGWEDVLSRHRITAVIWQDDRPLAALLEASERWEVVRRESPWVVAVPS